MVAWGRETLRNKEFQITHPRELQTRMIRTASRNVWGCRPKNMPGKCVKCRNNYHKCNRLCLAEVIAQILNFLITTKTLIRHLDSLNRRLCRMKIRYNVQYALLLERKHMKSSKLRW